MRKTCEEAMVPVITGDTKVVERGAVEKIVVNTSAKNGCAGEEYEGSEKIPGIGWKLVS